MQEISIISNIYLFTNKHTNKHSFHDRNLIRREKRKRTETHILFVTINWSPVRKSKFRDRKL